MNMLLAFSPLEFFKANFVLITAVLIGLIILPRSYKNFRLHRDAFCLPEFNLHCGAVSRFIYQNPFPRIIRDEDDDVAFTIDQIFFEYFFKDRQGRESVHVNTSDGQKYRLYFKNGKLTSCVEKNPCPLFIPKGDKRFEALMLDEQTHSEASEMLEQIRLLFKRQ